MNIIDEIKNFFTDLFCAPKRQNYQYQKNNNEKVSIFERGLNGKIDEPVYQGENGNCWFVSGILSMSYVENAAERFKNSMDIQKGGSAYMSFPGDNKVYRVSRSDMEKYNVPVSAKTSDYSRGDDDMLAAELACEKRIADKNPKVNYSMQTGGNPYYVYKLYDAEDVAIPKTDDSFRKALDNAMNNPNSYALSFGIVNKGIPGLKTGHSYAIKKVDNKTVTFVDPWEYTKEITMSKSDFIKNQNNISLVYGRFDKQS